MEDTRVLVLGRGFVGASVERALRSHGPAGSVEVLEPADLPELAARTSAGAERLRSHLVPGAVVVNCCGRLRGTDDELESANARWPSWLVDVIGGSGARLVHVGSASEYGDPGSAHPIAEDSPADPTGVYGETKWAGSSAVLDARRGGLDATVVRGFNLVSRDLPEVSPLHQFRSDVRALPPDGGDVELWYPATVRDFVLLDDLAAVVAALVHLDDVPDIVNACSGVGLDFGSIVEAIAAATGRTVSITSLDRPGILAVVGDPTRMRATTGVVAPMDARLLARTVLGAGP